MFGPDGASPNDDRPGIEELYESATNASSLKHYADRRSAADVLRDMAMSAEGIGAALLRLRGQWERAEKPTRQRTRSVKEFLAAGMNREEAEEANREERERHDRWHEREMQCLIAHLADLPAVRDAVTMQAVKWGMGTPGDPIERAERAELREMNRGMLAQYRKAVEEAGENEKAAAQATLNYWLARVNEIERKHADDDRARAQGKVSALIRYWLDQTCPGCDGRKFQTIAGTPKLSTKACPVCRASGVGHVPHGQEGRRLANYMDQCVFRYKQNMKTRRKALASIPPIDRLSKRMQQGGANPEAD